MPRLIDADEAKRNCERICDPYAVMAAKAQIDSTETMDAVPVVRCRECKHRKYDDIFGMIWCNRDSCTKRVKPDDFCSYGEKEGADHA